MGSRRSTSRTAPTPDASDPTALTVLTVVAQGAGLDQLVPAGNGGGFDEQDFAPDRRERQPGGDPRQRGPFLDFLGTEEAKVLGEDPRHMGVALKGVPANERQRPQGS